jgi:cysteine desulfurase/selenocysteine lyase
MTNFQQLRELMPVTKAWAFFDHAAVAPLSEPARQALGEYADDLASNGDVNESRWSARVEAVRRLLARLLNAEPEEIALVKNTSEGIDFVAEGFPWRPGDNVVIAEEEYPANVYPWLNLRDRGVEVRMTPTRDRRIWVDDIRARVDARTRVVSLSFVEFASGFRNDLDAIGQLCRERGVCFLVDAIQGLGVLPLDVKRTPIDFLAADGHKWLLGPEGAGVFFIRKELIDFLRPIAVGWHSVVGATDFSRIDFRLKPHAGRWESGTLNVGGIHTLGASVQLLLDAGIAVLHQRVIELTDYLCEQLSEQNLDVYSSRRPQDKSGIVSVSLPGRDLRQVVRHCRDQGIIVNHRAGRLRISPHAYNTHEELDRLLDAVSGERCVLP